MSEDYALPARVVTDLWRERVRQVEKWGPQSHPDGTAAGYAGMRDIARSSCDYYHRRGQGTWLHILLEEVYEAAAETNADTLREELVQVMAVAAAWIEDLDEKARA